MSDEHCSYYKFKVFRVNEKISQSNNFPVFLTDENVDLFFYLLQIFLNFDR